MRILCLALLASAVASPLHSQSMSGKTTKPKLPVPPKSAPLTPLTDRERAVQMLNRFTFGPRPGDIEHVQALGPDKWFEQQLDPQSIPDPALGPRLGDYPTLNMSAEQILTIFPDRGFIEQVAQGKRPYPADPLLAALYEVQVYKYNQQQESKKLTAAGTPPPEPSDAVKNQKKAQDQATAARISGDLFALPRNQRMPALIQMPVPDRITFTTYVAGAKEQGFFNGMNRLGVVTYDAIGWDVHADRKVADF